MSAHFEALQNETFAQVYVQIRKSKTQTVELQSIISPEFPCLMILSLFGVEQSNLPRVVVSHFHQLKVTSCEAVYLLKWPTISILLFATSLSKNP